MTKIEINFKLGVIAQIYNPSAGEAKEAGFKVLGWPVLHSKTLSQKKTKKIISERRNEMSEREYDFNIKNIQGAKILLIAMFYFIINVKVQIPY